MGTGPIIPQEVWFRIVKLKSLELTTVSLESNPFYKSARRSCHECGKFGARDRPILVPVHSMSFSLRILAMEGQLDFQINIARRYCDRDAMFNQLLEGSVAGRAARGPSEKKESKCQSAKQGSMRVSNSTP